MRTEASRRRYRRNKDVRIVLGERFAETYHFVQNARHAWLSPRDRLPRRKDRRREIRELGMWIGHGPFR